MFDLLWKKIIISQNLHNTMSAALKKNFGQQLSSSRPPLWSSGHSFWLQIQRSRVRSPALPDFLTSKGGLERGPLSLVITTEELLEKKK
jgi:hypothetical protein